MVKNYNLNVLYFTKGKSRFTNSPETWYEKYNLDFKIETDDVKEKSSFLIRVLIRNRN